MTFSHVAILTKKGTKGIKACCSNIKITECVPTNCQLSADAVQCYRLKWFSIFNTNKRTGKGHNSANFLRNSVKSHLNMDPKQYSEYQDPCSRNFLHIVLRGFSIVIIAKSEKGHNSINILQNLLKS